MGLRTGGRRAKGLKNRVISSKIELRFREVRPEGCTSCSPVLQALIIFQYAFLRLCFGRAVFCCPFPGEQGSTTAHLRRLPRKGRAGGAYKTLLKHRVQGAALPAMLPSSPSADYISDATLRLCFGRAVFLLPLSRRTGEHDCASPAVAPQGASRRRLLIFAQASRAKTKSMGLRLFCKLFVNPIDKVGGQEYIFSSRADRVLKTKQTAP